MFVRTTLAVLAAAIVIETGSAFAQSAPAGPPATAAPHAERRGMWPMLESLKLTDAQRAKVEAIQQKYRQQNQNATDREQRWANMRAERKEIMAVLTPEQRQTLEQRMKQMHDRHRDGAAPSGTPLP